LARFRKRARAMAGFRVRGRVMLSSKREIKRVVRPEATRRDTGRENIRQPRTGPEKEKKDNA
jgi:hypothetical protein